MSIMQCNTHKSPPVWGTQEDSTGSVVSANESNISDNSLEFPIDVLPLEILYLIFERLDAETLVNCLRVSKKWRSVVFGLANGDKSNLTWQTMLDLYHGEDTFKTKSCGLPYRDLFANLLRWNLDLKVSMYGSCLINNIKKINIYRDSIIVVDVDGVKYVDVYKHNIKRSLLISECVDFNERDTFVLRTTQSDRDNETDLKLFLYGKSNRYDDSYEYAVQCVMDLEDAELNHDNAILINKVGYYAIENNRCYVINAHNSALTCYTWSDNKRWDVSSMGRFYGNRNDIIYAMHILNTEVLLLTKWGQMIAYCYDKRSFQEVHRIRMPMNKNLIVKIVHKYCVVIGVTSDCEFRITRIRNNEGYNYYKFECPNLSCVTQHGELLFLGFLDGKIEIYMPRAPSRKAMFKRRIRITDFVSDPLDPQDLIVISVEVFEDFERHFLFITTHSAVYHLVVEHTEPACIWDNIPKRTLYYKHPIRTGYAL